MPPPVPFPTILHGSTLIFHFRFFQILILNADIRPYLSLTGICPDSLHMAAPEWSSPSSFAKGLSADALLSGYADARLLFPSLLLSVYLYLSIVFFQSQPSFRNSFKLNSSEFISSPHNTESMLNDHTSLFPPDKGFSSY